MKNPRLIPSIETVRVEILRNSISKHDLVFMLRNTGFRHSLRIARGGFASNETGEFLFILTTKIISK